MLTLEGWHTSVKDLDARSCWLASFSVKPMSTLVPMVTPVVVAGEVTESTVEKVGEAAPALTVTLTVLVKGAPPVTGTETVSVSGAATVVDFQVAVARPLPSVLAVMALLLLLKEPWPAEKVTASEGITFDCASLTVMASVVVLMPSSRMLVGLALNADDFVESAAPGAKVAAPVCVRVTELAVTWTTFPSATVLLKVMFDTPLASVTGALRPP